MTGPAQGGGSNENYIPKGPSGCSSFSLGHANRELGYLASFIPTGRRLPGSSAHSPRRRSSRQLGRPRPAPSPGGPDPHPRRGPRAGPEDRQPGRLPNSWGVPRTHSLRPAPPRAPYGHLAPRLQLPEPPPAPSRPPKFLSVALAPQLPPDPPGSPSVGRSRYPPRKFLITSFLEPPPPPGLEETAAAARDAGLVRPLVCPTSAEKLPFLGVSSAMAAAGKQWAPRPVRPSSPPPPRAARLGLPPPLPSATPGPVSAAPARPNRRTASARPGPAPLPPRPRPGHRPWARERGQSASAGVRVELATVRGAAEQKPYQAPGTGAPWAGRSTQGARTRRPRPGVVGGLAAERSPAFLSPGTSPRRSRARAPTNTASGTNVRGKLGLRSRAGNGPSRK